MKSFYFVSNSGSFRLTKKNSSIENGILAATQSEELADDLKYLNKNRLKGFYFASNNYSFRLAKRNESIENGILGATQSEELANDVKYLNKHKRDFLKVMGVAGLGLAGTALFPKKADALILGGTPTSSVVGVKNVANTRVNPATEETLDEVLKTTDLTFDAGSLQVKVTSLPAGGSSFSDSGGTPRLALVDDARNVQVDVVTSALPSSASTETTLQTIAFGGKKYALKMTTVGSIDYVAEADTGTAFATAEWRVKKVDSTSGIVITWADGDEEFNNYATNLPGLTYS